MKEIIFITGGCRSGKSSYALQTGQQISENKRLFIATCIPYDDEMNQRVLKHKKERDLSWKTLEVPLYLSEALIEHSKNYSVILIDCLTLWLSNLLCENTPDKIYSHIEKFILSLEKAQCSVIVVSNEVGMGIVPENKLARVFRDLIGYANQCAAKCADKVIFMVSGIPLKIKD